MCVVHTYKVYANKWCRWLRWKPWWCSRSALYLLHILNVATARRLNVPRTILYAFPFIAILVPVYGFVHIAIDKKLLSDSVCRTITLSLRFMCQMNDVTQKVYIENINFTSVGWHKRILHWPKCHWENKKFKGMSADWAKELIVITRICFPGFNW